MLSGGGGVKVVRDAGDIAANTVPQGKDSLPDDNLNYATYAEKVWQFFDSAASKEKEHNHKVHKEHKEKRTQVCAL